MVGVILYTLMEFINFYLAYRNVFGICFTKRKLPYVIIIAGACLVQVFVMYMVDNTWRDVIILVAGLVGAVILSESKKSKVILLYPIAYMLPSMINIIGSYIVAMLLGIVQEAVIGSNYLILLCECTAILAFTIYGYTVKKKRYEEISLTAGQYTILLIGVICFLVVIVFFQGIVKDDQVFVNDLKNLVVVASLVIALFFIILCLWQQSTWKKAFQYRVDNEKYEMFLSKQEEYIRMLINEDEKRRKLRHDMNAHMLALNAMVEKEEWEMLREYLQQMQDSLSDATVNKYTMISAVDAIIDEWHDRALVCQTIWSWEGTLNASNRGSVFELCTVFSNLLSNAVEAVENTDKERRIEIKVSDFQGKTVLSVGNTCDIKGSMQGRPGTTKDDKEMHGLGLKNVEEIVKKYEGSIDYEIKDGWFQVDIVL